MNVLVNYNEKPCNAEEDLRPTYLGETLCPYCNRVTEVYDYEEHYYLNCLCRKGLYGIKRSNTIKPIWEVWHIAADQTDEYYKVFKDKKEAEDWAHIFNA